MSAAPRATVLPVDSIAVRRAFRRQLLIGGLVLALLAFATLVLLLELRLNEEVQTGYRQALSIAQRVLDAHRLALQLSQQPMALTVDRMAGGNAARQDLERWLSQLQHLHEQIDQIPEPSLTADERIRFRQIESALAGIVPSAPRPAADRVPVDPDRNRTYFETIASSLDALSASVSTRALQATERSRTLDLLARYSLGVAALLAVSFGGVFSLLMWRSQATSREVMGALDRMAREDGLTGITNRRGLDDGLMIELARARRSGETLTVVMLDLDYFKRYNDRRGHGAGDVLLRGAAQAWRRQLRPTDLLARYGGEEFTLVLPSCDAEAACHLIERLRPLVPERQTFSAGVAIWEEHESPEQLLRRADQALLVAKKQGRNRTVVSGDEPQMSLPLKMA